MFVPGVYNTPSQNMDAVRQARLAVLDSARNVQARLRDDPVVLRPITGGNGRIINIHV